MQVTFDAKAPQHTPHDLTCWDTAAHWMAALRDGVPYQGHPTG